MHPPVLVYMCYLNHKGISEMTQVRHGQYPNGESYYEHRVTSTGRTHRIPHQKGYDFAVGRAQHDCDRYHNTRNQSTIVSISTAKLTRRQCSQQRRPEDANRKVQGLGPFLRLVEHLHEAEAVGGFAFPCPCWDVLSNLCRNF